jgi:hypothetical protein
MLTEIAKFFHLLPLSDGTRIARGAKEEEKERERDREREIDIYFPPSLHIVSKQQKGGREICQNQVKIK